MNQSLEIIFEADGKKERFFTLPYKFGSWGIGAYAVPSHACLNMFHPGRLWSWRNAASALPFSQGHLVGDREMGSQNSALMKAVTGWSKLHIGIATLQEESLPLGTTGKRR